MKLVGYCDPWIVKPGEQVNFMVSSEVARYDASVVRLVLGDSNPAGPGPIEVALPSAIDGSYSGERQWFKRGSCVVVNDDPRLRFLDGVSLSAWVYPTLPKSDRLQGVVTKLSVAKSLGYGLVLNELGCPALWLGDGSRSIVISSKRPLRAGEWYYLEASLVNGVVHLQQKARRQWPSDPSCGSVEVEVGIREQPWNGPLLIGALDDDSEPDSAFGGHFDGKIDSPSLYRDSSVVARWDFSRGMQTLSAYDTGPGGHHGRLWNFPARGMTGYNYTGREVCYRLAPEEYGAIHFHSDDLLDADWDVSFSLEIPSDWHSGYYAVKLTSSSEQDYIPFFIAPRHATSQLALMVPTFTYLAYGSEHITTYRTRNPSLPHSPPAYRQPADFYIEENELLSLYDKHRDGSGSCYASWRRPLANMRPGYRMTTILGPRHLGADLHTVAWLTQQGYDFDVITDHQVHEEGVHLLAQYRAIVSGSHHEYWTMRMLDAVEDYLTGGGRFAYLSGNGLYWPVGITDLVPHMMEVRRGQNGTGTWQSEPGENYLHTTGEPGGLWRDRGRAPQRLVGVGMSAAGFDAALPFRRLPDSNNPRARFIFDRVRDHELIGDQGYIMGGAGGLELDRADRKLGTPHHTLVVATVDGFSESYTPATEELPGDPSIVRGDMVFFEWPNGGAVFSVGSITWVGSLLYNNADNPVSRITQNVIDAFLSEMLPDKTLARSEHA